MSLFLFGFAAGVAFQLASFGLWLRYERKRLNGAIAARLVVIRQAWADGTPTPGCACTRCEEIRAKEVRA